jgi:phytoene dehydrogenase-like protein
MSGELEDLYSRPQTTTLQHLKSIGFSDQMIERFFRPFLGGVFLEPELMTSSRKFEFVFRMFAMGDNALPAGGMGAIPEQLASRLPADQIRTGVGVESVEHGKVVLSSGEALSASAIVIATGGVQASRLVRHLDVPAAHSVICVYFTSERPPIEEPVLVLNGAGQGPVNNLCVLSQVAPEYAPVGKSLISVSVLRGEHLRDDRLVTDVLDQMGHWFGPKVAQWQHLKTDRIPEALPAQPPEALEPVERECQIEPGVFICGDYRHLASINGAMLSGRRAAEAVIDSLL